MDLGLAGKIICVTGAASGIGAQVARSFCKERAKTIFIDINRQGLEDAIQGYEKYGVYRVCDVSDRLHVKTIFMDIQKILGPIHVLINNAAVNTADYIENIQSEDFERVQTGNTQSNGASARSYCPPVDSEKIHIFTRW